MEPDPYRKYPIRICGLGLALGEALKFNYGKSVVGLCSTMAGTYIIFHALNRGMVAVRAESPFGPAAVDSLIFDTFASALIPSFYTYHVCRLTFRAVLDSEAGPTPSTMWLPTLVGLCVLFLLTNSVDQCVDTMMDKTIRPLGGAGQTGTGHLEN